MAFSLSLVNENGKAIITKNYFTHNPPTLEI